MRQPGNWANAARRRIVEDHGGRRFNPGRRFDPVAEFHRAERIEAQFPELPVGAHRVGGVVPEHRGPRATARRRAARVRRRACSSRRAGQRDRPRTGRRRTRRCAWQRGRVRGTAVAPPPMPTGHEWRRDRSAPARRRDAAAGSPRRTAQARPATTSAPSRADSSVLGPARPDARSSRWPAPTIPTPGKPPAVLGAGDDVRARRETHWPRRSWPGPANRAPRPPRRTARTPTDRPRG